MGASVLLGRIHRAGRLALTAAELEALLRALAPDRAEAGQRYEALRRRLLIVFAARHSGSDTAALADEVLDRVARRLNEGIPIETSVEAYVLGVARNVAREQARIPRAETPLPAHLAAVAPEPEDPAHDCLERCLAGLQPSPRAWVLRFYTGSGSAKIAERSRLARELGLEPNALRVRMFRLRSTLEACLESCLSAAGNESGGRIT